MNTARIVNTNYVPYWNDVKTLGRNDRIMLINLLSASLIADGDDVATRPVSLDACYGSWGADEASANLIKEIDSI